jgi:shikimate dehydrogenase
MHNAAFQYTGCNGVYLAFKIEDAASAVLAIRTLNIQGVSVTIPHKVSIMPLLDELSPEAQKIGAVNTVINKDGILIGHNSDCLGAAAALKEKTDLPGKHAAVIGAGGAARAVAFGLREAGCRVVIVNRSADKGERLAADLGADFCPLSDFTGSECQILINTTPVGMIPKTDAAPIPADLLRPGMTVMDIVYNPLETRLLKNARIKGCVAVDGAAMFVYQGAFQFELWTGQAAPLDLMRKTVLNALGK